MSASCTAAPTAREALLTLQSAPNTLLLADVTDATHPHTLCTLTGGWSPELVTQRMISWWATQTPGQAGTSVLATMDLFTGTTTVLSTWQGGFYMDGLHSWSPDVNALAYVTSSASALNLHLLSGGGDQVVATLGSVPGRGVNPSEDDAFVAFSADSTYFALVQTFTTSGAQLQIRRSRDGTLAYSQATGTMATWSSTGSRLFFREPGHTTIKAWDPTSGVSQLIGLAQAWIRPRADAGDDYVAYTVRDPAGLPHVWVYGHSGRAGGQINNNVRASPMFLNASQIVVSEEASCGANCGPGPPTQPDGHNFIFNLATQSETPSTIDHALGSWPRIGQT